jgi:hypothetical protein
MSSNVTTTTNNVATLTSHPPKAQTANEVIAANVIEQLEAGGAESVTSRHLIYSRAGG